MATAKQAAKWLDAWQATLGLQHWEINLVCVDDVAFEGKDGGRVTGEVEWHYNALCATMTIAYRAEDVELTIVHELLHLVLAELHCLHQSTSTIVGGQAWALLDQQAADAEERAVRTLERAIEKLRGRPNARP